MADRRIISGARFRGLLRAPGFRLRSFLLVTSLVSLAVAGWSAATGRTSGLLAGSAGFVLLLLLGFVAQEVAERSGAIERDRLREEELRAEMATWPRWKQIAFLLVALVISIGITLLFIWSMGFSPG